MLTELTADEHVEPREISLLPVRIPEMDQPVWQFCMKQTIFISLDLTCAVWSVTKSLMPTSTSSYVNLQQLDYICPNVDAAEIPFNGGIGTEHIQWASIQNRK